MRYGQKLVRAVAGGLFESIQLSKTAEGAVGAHWAGFVIGMWDHAWAFDEFDGPLSYDRPFNLLHTL